MQISHLADTMCHDLPSGLKVCPNHIGLAPCTQVKAQVMRRSPTLQVPSPKKLTATWSAFSSPSTSCHCAAPNHSTANRAVLALLTSSQQDQTHAPGKRRQSQLKPVSQPWQGDAHLSILNLECCAQANWDTLSNEGESSKLQEPKVSIKSLVMQ